MLELFETSPPVNVPASGYTRLLGFPPGHLLEGRSRELADWARRWYAENGRPWFYARQLDALALAGGKLRVGDAEFSSSSLHDLFAEAQADQAMLVAVSAGGECEAKARELWLDGKPDEYFFLEVFGSAVVEHLVTVASGRLCGWADQHNLATLPHSSPGYSGWDIADQVRLWDLIRRNGSHHFDGRLAVLDSGMLRPKKSLLAVFGLTRHLEKARRLANWIPCENCSLPDCQYRRGPYRHAAVPIEDVHVLQANPTDDPGPGSFSEHVLAQNARYAINPRALEKWSRERLDLNFLPDGSTEAKFRYEGTTCSNAGRALEFDYVVQLAPPAEAYKILDLRCAPAPGDTGHQFQCAYLNDAEPFMREITEERPLLGRPLNDVFNWERPYNPSGCYCDLDRRSHKWGLVFEVIHYALVQREKQMSYRQPAVGLK